MDELKQYVTVTFPVRGMTCQSCVKRVKAALSKLDGIITTDVDLADQTVRVDYESDTVTPDILKKSVSEAGYAVPDGITTAPAASENDGEYARTAFSKSVPFVLGFAAAFGVIGFYLGMLTMSSDWYFAKVQFEDYRWWIIALALGLGTQVALYANMRIRLRRMAMRGAKSSLAASGGVSAAAMAACCAHFVPTLGLPFLSAAAAGLVRFQMFFFLFGVLSNLFGIGFMIRMMMKNGISVSGVFTGRLHIGPRSS